MMPDSTVQVCAYWQKGDKIAYDCKYTTVRTDKDSTQTTIRSASETRIFEVLEATESSYILQTSYKDVFDSNLSLNAGAEATNRIAEATVLQTRTNELGMVQELVNLDEMVEMMRKNIPTIVDATLAKYDKKELKKSGLNRNDMIKGFTEVFCRPETVVTTCLNDVVPLLTYHGARLALNEEYTVKQQFQSPFPNTKGTMETDMKFWVDTEMTDSVAVVIRSYAFVDNDQMMPFVREFMINSYEATSPGSPDTGDLAKLIDKTIAESHMTASMEEFTVVEIHLASGWPTQWFSTRNVIVETDEGQTVNTVEKEVVLAEE
jgi:hypothetical protein